jgi:hypothetical protein
LCELGLVRVHQFGAALPDHAGQVRDPNVLARHTELDEQAQAGERRSAGTGGDELDLQDVLAGDGQAVKQCCADDNRGAVLVVVEHGDLHALAQLALDVEAIRRLDVFEVDAAERRLQRGDHVDQLVEVVLGDLDVENVDAGELLEEHALAFHHRLGGERADVAQSKHRGAIGHHRDEVAARGVAESVALVGGDLLARRSNAGRVGQREVALVGQRFRRRDGHLARRRELVVLQGIAAQLGALFFVGGHGFSSVDRGACMVRANLRPRTRD